MKRSEINALVTEASECFAAHGWTLPPAPRWDVTDFSLCEPARWGLVLVNLAEEPEYCEKLMFARRGMTTPAHCHRKKKEDIIARWGTFAIQVWNGPPSSASSDVFTVPINGVPARVHNGEIVPIPAGTRITLIPGIYHEFYPVTAQAIIGEVSTANDDLHDNFFQNENVGRFTPVEEDEPPIVKLVSDRG
jgi:D-lyxose ketol-isomerase